MKSKLVLFTVASAMALTITSHAALVLTESFDYPDGTLVGASGSPWTTHSGTTGQIDVTGGAITISGSESEDVNAPLDGSPHTTGELTATFDITFTALPTSTTTYFAHFFSTSTVFRGKLFSTLTGAEDSYFRLGITNNANTLATSGVTVPLDLALNTTYSVTLTYDIENVVTSLSIDGGTPVVASDVVSGAPSPINGFAFRQSTGIGTMVIDNLTVNAVPEPTISLLSAIGAFGLLRRRR